jgi:predicted esterase
VPNTHRNRLSENILELSIMGNTVSTKPEYDPLFVNEVFMSSLDDFSVEHLHLHQKANLCNLVQFTVQGFLGDLRTYLIHAPNCIDVDSSTSIGFKLRGSRGEQEIKQEPVPLVILLHGTDETMFDCELVHQEDEDVCSWLELSDELGFIVAVPQARGNLVGSDDARANTSWRKDKLRTLWKCAFAEEEERDRLFIEAMINDIQGKTNRMVNEEKIFLLGFSNGGYYTCDLALSSNFRYVRSSCAYMGGLTSKQTNHFEQVRNLEIPKMDAMVSQSLVEENETFTIYRGNPVPASFNEPTRNILLITGKLDNHASSVFLAWRLFTQLERKCELHLLKKTRHAYQAKSTEIIWKWFTEHSDANSTQAMKK